MQGGENDPYGLRDISLLAHLAIVFGEPSMERFKERMTLRDYVFWREIYTPEYGLQCNGSHFQWKKTLSESERVSALIVGLGGVMSANELDELKKIEQQSETSSQ